MSVGLVCSVGVRSDRSDRSFRCWVMIRRSRSSMIHRSVMLMLMLINGLFLSGCPGVQLGVQLGVQVVSISDPSMVLSISPVDSDVLSMVSVLLSLCYRSQVSWCYVRRCPDPADSYGFPGVQLDWIGLVCGWMLVLFVIRGPVVFVRPRSPRSCRPPIPSQPFPGPPRRMQVYVRQ